MSNVIDSIKVSGTVYTLSAQTGGGGSPTVELTQAQYDALVTAGTVAQDTYYIITDASPAEMSQYWTSAQTNSAITQATSGKLDTSTFETYSGSVETALSGKQDTLVSGTNIKTINNESILGSGNIDIQGGGGGKTIEAGRGISITTGATADTVSFNLPIYSGTGEGSIFGGYSGNTASGKYSIALGGRYEGWADYNYCTATNKGSVSFGGEATGQGAFTCGESTKASGRNAAAIACYIGEASGVESFITGRKNEAKGFTTFVSGFQNIGENDYEFVAGHLAKSNKASTTFGDSGNTLFSVGNGTSTSARHNAFEIRQNGDIYCSDGTNDVKLQDTITATAANTTALGGLKLVKLTQAEYDALSPNYDSNTLYVIVN